MGGFVNTAWKDTGYQVYECINCNQLWALYAPENSDRGAFMAISSETRTGKTNVRYNSKNKRGLGIEVLIILGVLIVYLIS